MERNDSDATYLNDVAGLIDEPTLTKIDFDDLTQRLTAIAARIRADGTLIDSHARLRDDYQIRIAGMIKAIAAVDRKRDGWAEALELVETLPSMSIDRLLQVQRRIATRFRNCFHIRYCLTNLREISLKAHSLLRCFLIWYY